MQLLPRRVLLPLMRYPYDDSWTIDARWVLFVLLVCWLLLMAFTCPAPQAREITGSDPIADGVTISVPHLHSGATIASGRSCGMLTPSSTHSVSTASNAM